MIYVDTNIVLAEVFAEDRHPDSTFWENPLITSRLLQYEAIVSVTQRGEARHRRAIEQLFFRLRFLELAAPVLSRALEPFPLAVRTLDAIHLASMAYLIAQNIPVQLATYDERKRTAAQKLKFDLVDL